MGQIRAAFGQDMPSKTRVPNKLQWGLNDIIMASAQARKASNQLQDYFSKRKDPRMLAALLDLVSAIAEIERKAILAREGQYEE